MAGKFITGRTICAGVPMAALSGFIFLEAALAPKSEP